jgi:hypothetical protein
MDHSLRNRLVAAKKVSPTMVKFQPVKSTDGLPERVGTVIGAIVYGGIVLVLVYTLLEKYV